MLTIIDIDWDSFPRLVAGRIFSKSPHLYEGDVQDTKYIEIPVSGLEAPLILTMDVVQERLQSETFAHALKKDPELASSKVFYWKGADGAHYWLPIIEGIRSLFARSPEMTRAMLLYDGWHELVEDWRIAGEVLHISCTSEPKITDIPRLAWIASEPGLLKAWHELETFLPNLDRGVSPSISWPFKHPFTLKAFAKVKGSQHWLTEISNYSGWPLKYTQLARHHPALIRDKVDESLEARLVSDYEDEQRDEDQSKDVVTQTTLQPRNSSIVSRPKQYTHIQSALYDEIDQIQTVDQKEEKHTPPNKNEVGSSKGLKPQEYEISVKGALSDTISGAKHGDTFGVGLRESSFDEGLGGLQTFKKAMVKASEILEGSSLTWIISGEALKSQKPEKCGSRWFFEMKDNSERQWCFVRLQYQGHSFYFVEIGRDAQDDNLAISTLFSVDRSLDAAVHIQGMIKNGGHWQKSLLSKDVSWLPHRNMNNSSAWGDYVSKKISSYQRRVCDDQG